MHQIAQSMMAGYTSTEIILLQHSKTIKVEMKMKLSIFLVELFF